MRIKCKEIKRIEKWITSGPLQSCGPGRWHQICPRETPGSRGVWTQWIGGSVRPGWWVGFVIKGWWTRRKQVGRRFASPDDVERGNRVTGRGGVVVKGVCRDAADSGGLGLTHSPVGGGEGTGSLMFLICCCVGWWFRLLSSKARWLQKKGREIKKGCILIYCSWYFNVSVVYVFCSVFIFIKESNECDRGRKWYYVNLL